MSFFHFLRGDEKPGGGVFGFLETAARGGKGEGGGAFGTLRRTRDIGVGVGRGLARVPETASRSWVELTGGQPQTSAPPTDPIRRFLYGSELVETYQSQSGKLSEATGGRVPAPLIAATLAGLDITPLGRGKKGIEGLIKASTPQEVKKIVKGISDEGARAIAITKDRHAIENILSKTKPSVAPDIISPVPKAGEVIPPPSANAFDDILGAVAGKSAASPEGPVKGIASISREQKLLLKSERGKRLKAATEAGKKYEGSQRYFIKKSKLEGGYGQNAEFNPLINDIGEQRAEELFIGAQKQIDSIPDSVYTTDYKRYGLRHSYHPDGARLNTETAVRKVLGLEPGIPTKSELELLAVHSPKLAAEIKAATPRHRKIFDAAGALFGGARASKSTADLSMGGRQGLFVSGRHPVEWARANKESVKYAKSTKYYDQEMTKIHGDDWGQFINDRDKSVLTGGASHEEAYAGVNYLTGKTAKKLGYGHVVAGSERAYTGGLTKLRKDILVKNFKAYGDTPEQVIQTLGPKGVDGLIEAVRTLTGRGGKKGGWIARNHEILTDALFSPKLWASRLELLNPFFWARIGPAGRKEAIESLGSFAAVASTVLSAAVVAGAEVETDPRSSDFLKVKVGDTRYDILGGFQQNLVFGARQIAGETKSSQTGKLTEFGEGFGAPTRLTSAFDLVRGKANPALGSLANLIEGEDKAGNKINPATEIGQLFVPIAVQGAYHGIQREGLKGLAMNLPDFGGISTQAYGIQDLSISDKQKEQINKLEEQGATKEQVTATKSFYQNLKVGAASRQKEYDKYKEAIIAGDTQTAIQIANDYNEKLAQALDEWDAQYAKYATENLKAEYRRQKINPTKASIRSILKEQNKSTRELQLVP